MNGCPHIQHLQVQHLQGVAMIPAKWDHLAYRILYDSCEYCIKFASLLSLCMFGTVGMTFARVLAAQPVRNGGKDTQLEQAKQQESKRNGSGRIYKIFSIVEKPGNEKSLWLDIGVGRLNRDDSITCKLDCLPLNGVIQIRPHDGRRSGHMNVNSKKDGGYQG